MQLIYKRRAAGAASPRPASFFLTAISFFLVCRPICLGLALLSTPGAHPADAGTVRPSTPIAFETGYPFAAWIAEAAHRFDIPASWVRNVMRVESRYDAHVVSPKGAMGLMQLMPETWADLRLRYGLGNDPFDPRDNILAGAAYLRELHDRYGDAGFIAAYNAGPASYHAYLATGRPLPDETLAYVRALAPVTPSTSVEAHLVVASEAPSSAEAPLFVLQGDRPSTATPRSFPAQHGPSPDVGRAVDLTGFVPQSTGLFVPISDRNATQ